MWKEYFLSFVVLTICMAAVQAVLFVPMAALSNGHLPSANQLTVGLLVTEFLGNLWLATQVSAVLLATAFMVDWLAPPDFQINTRFAQMTVGAVLGALLFTIFVVLQLMSVARSKTVVMNNVVFVLFTYAIPASIAVAALAPHILRRVWGVRLARHVDRPVPGNVGEIDGFVHLLVAASEDQKINATLQRLLAMPRDKRQGLVHTWVSDLLIEKAPADLVRAIACLMDDAVAQKVSEVISRTKGH